MKKMHGKQIVAGVLAPMMLIGCFSACTKSPERTITLSQPTKLNVTVHMEKQNEIYVSPKGNDANPGTFEQPLKTITAARNFVRTLNDNMQGDIVVYLRGGEYVQNESLNFTEKDSGTNGHMITYRPYKGEKVVISGGCHVKNWSLYDAEKNIWKATFKNAPEGFDTRQLYVNDKRAIRAKGDLADGEFITAPKDNSDPSAGLYSSNLDMVNWKNQNGIEAVFFGSAWTSPRVLVDHIVKDGDKAHLIMNSRLFPIACNKGLSAVAAAPSWIENAYELLDEAGEWYLDKTGAVSGDPNTFFYKPQDGENMETAEVVTPVLEDLMQIESSNLDNPVTNLQFYGLNFKYATWLRPSRPEIGGQSDVQDNNIRETVDEVTGGNIRLSCTQNIIFERCEFSKMGNAALYLQNANKDDLVNGCHFYDLSAQAIKIGNIAEDDYRNFYVINPEHEYALKPDDPDYYEASDWDFRYLQTNNDVTNNIIHNIGLEFFSASAIGTGVIEESDISHNEIYETPYSGLHIGYGWGKVKDAMLPMGNNKIQFNYIHEVCQKLKDGGGIYCNGNQYGTSGEDGWERSSLISNNYIKNQKFEYGSLYLDDGACYYEVRNNVVENTPWFILNKHPQNDVHDNYGNNKKRKNTKSDKWDKSSYSHALHDNHFVRGEFPEEAQKIMREAGLEPQYSHMDFCDQPMMLEKTYDSTRIEPTDSKTATEDFCAKKQTEKANEQEIALFRQLAATGRFGSAQYDALWIVTGAIMNPNSAETAETAKALDHLGLLLQSSKLIESHPLGEKQNIPACVVARILDRDTKELVITFYRG